MSVLKQASKRTHTHTHTHVPHTRTTHPSLSYTLKYRSKQLYCQLTNVEEMCHGSKCTHSHIAANHKAKKLTTTKENIMLKKKEEKKKKKSHIKLKDRTDIFCV